MIILKRALSIFLASLIVLSFAACAADSVDNSRDKVTGVTDATTGPGNETTIFYEADSLPELNFGGETVLILSESEYNPEGVKDILPEITVEELTSDIINDSIYNRRLFVEDRLGVKIENYQLNIALLDDEIMKQYNSQDDNYDIFVHSAHSLATQIFNGFLLDLYEVDHLDFTKPWWSEKFNAASELEDSLYVTTGSLALTLDRNLYAIFYNKTLADNYSAKIPELGDLYGIVERGEWTFDKFVELGGDIYEDNNGDSAYDMEDLYGIFYPKYIPIDCIWSGFDIDVFSRTDDGWFELNVNTDKAYTALEKLHNLLFNVQGSFTAGGFEHDEYGAPVYFSSGNLLFALERLGSIEWPHFRNMQDDYGILPYPKYDMNQKEYYSYAHERFSGFSIPNTNDEADIAGAVLEAMASYAYRETEPAFLNTALKGKYMTDATSRYMLDTVIDGFMLDSAWIYDGNLGSGYLTSYRYMLADNDTSFATNHEKLTKKVNIALKVYKDIYEKLNG